MDENTKQEWKGNGRTEENRNSRTKIPEVIMDGDAFQTRYLYIQATGLASLRSFAESSVVIRVRGTTERRNPMGLLPSRWVSRSESTVAVSPGRELEACQSDSAYTRTVQYLVGQSLSAATGCIACCLTTRMHVDVCTLQSLYEVLRIII